MKKIFLLLGITFSVSTFAQQKDLFDIDRYIQKKLTEKLKTAGKEKPVPFLPQKYIPAYPISNNTQMNYTFSNGDRVVILPFDNMPCVVPNMSQFQAMPNPGRNILAYNFNVLPKRLPGVIPNGALPFKIIVDDQPGY